MKRWLCLIGCLLVLSGCRGFGGGSPNERAVAQMLAVDRLGEEIRVTVRLLAQDGTPENGQSASAEGKTISAAVSKIGQELGKELFLRDTRLILLGRGLCEEGIGVCRRYLTGGFDIRPRASVVGTQGDASGYLTAEPGKEAPADALLPVLQWSARSDGAGITVLELERNMNASGGDGFLPLLRLTEDGKAEMSGGLFLHKEKTSRPIEQEERKAIQFLYLNPEQETLTLEHSGAQAVVRITSCNRSLRAEIREEMPEFTLTGRFAAELLEWTGAGEPPQTEELERLAENAIRQLLEQGIRDSVFDGNADLIGMDSALRRDVPWWWEQYRNRWQNDRGESVFYLQVKCDLAVQER